MAIRTSFQLSNYTKKVNRLLNTRRREHLLAATVKWHEGIVVELKGNRRGRLYRVPGTAKKYRASKPGEAPASRTGQLRQSYRFRVVGPNYMERGEVGSPLDRALWLEKGTSKMAPRPHVEKAYFKNKPAILNELGKRLDK